MPYPWILLLVGLGTGAVLASEPTQQHDEQHNHEQHHSHVHGEAELLVAVEGPLLELELTSPAMNIVGFEHRPDTETQTSAVHHAIARLGKPDALFGLPAAAGCDLAAAEVETGLLAHVDHETAHSQGHDSGHTEPATDADGHAEFHAHYRYRCGQPQALTGIEVRLFAHFPGVRQIRAQTISDRGQHEAQLDQHHSHLPL